MRFLIILLFSLVQGINAQSTWQWQRQLSADASDPAFYIGADERHGLFFTGHASGIINIWTLEGQLIQRYRWHSGPVSDISLNPAKTIIATASYDGKVAIYRYPEGTPIRIIANPGRPPYGDWQGNEVAFARFGQAGEYIYFGGYNGRLYRQSLRGGRLELLYESTRGALTTACLQADGQLVFGDYQQLCRYDPATERITLRKAMIAPICELVSDEQQLWIYDQEGRISQMQDSEILQAFSVNELSGSRLFACSPDEQTLFAPNGKYIDLWEVSSDPAYQNSLHKHQSPVKAIAANGLFLLSGDENGQLHLWSKTHGPHQAATTEVPVGVVIQDSITLEIGHLRVDIRDDREIDGDVISLYLDDQLLLSKHRLQGVPTVRLLDLSSGEYLLKVQAHNLGDIPPNTAALRLYTSKGVKEFVLHSEPGISGALKIIVKNRVTSVPN